MKYLARYILMFFCYLLYMNSIKAQAIKDVSFEAEGEQIIIYYTLTASEADEYEITTILKRLNDASFSYVPENLSNDIGEGQYAGVRKSIIWDVTEDESAMFDGDDFYFEVFAEKIGSSGGIPWYYYVGTAVVGGGVAAAVLLGGSDESNGNGTTPITSNFPNPPTRP